MGCLAIKGLVMMDACKLLLLLMARTEDDFRFHLFVCKMRIIILNLQALNGTVKLCFKL